MESRPVAITIVTYNSSRYIRQCLRYVLSQDYPRTEVIIVDNASVDGTQAILREFEDRARIVYNRENNGFAGGQNQAVALSKADWVLTLNPDVRLTGAFVSLLVRAGEADRTAGSVCGKLLAMSPEFEPLEPRVFDSAGIYMTPNLRHFDRGAQVADHGQYDRTEYVFGGTGAACLYRREMIQDVSIDGEFFDSDFFAYREDADVAWRAQLLGWSCVYVPAAIAYHVRRVRPQNRGSLPAVLNMHSVKNRWLLRVKNIGADLYWRHWFHITVRDILVIGGCLLGEWRSLRAFVLLYRCWPGAWRKRCEIMKRRRATSDSIARWFSYEPVSFPIPETAAKVAARENMASK